MEAASKRNYQWIYHKKNKKESSFFCKSDSFAEIFQSSLLALLFLSKRNLAFPVLETFEDRIIFWQNGIRNWMCRGPFAGFISSKCFLFFLIVTKVYLLICIKTDFKFKIKIIKHFPQNRTHIHRCVFNREYKTNRLPSQLGL